MQQAREIAGEWDLRFHFEHVYGFIAPSQRSRRPFSANSAV